MSYKKNNDKSGFITVFHGTHSKKENIIRKEGLISGSMGYDNPSWYVVSTDLDSALFHSTPEQGGDAIVFEFKVPVENSKWEGYPYFWPPYNRGSNSKWFALKQPIPAKMISKIHKISYDDYLNSKNNKLNESNNLDNNFLDWLSEKLGKRIGRKIGGGMFGQVFELGSAVIKISNKQMFDSESIANKKIPGVARVYAHGKINVPNKFIKKGFGGFYLDFPRTSMGISRDKTLYYLIMEKVHTSNDIELPIEDIVWALESYFDDYKKSSSEVPLLRELFEKRNDEYFIIDFVNFIRNDYLDSEREFNKYLETLSELLAVFRSVGKHFDWMDIHAGQFGRNSKGELVAFDLDNPNLPTKDFYKHVVSENSSKIKCPNIKLTKEIIEFINNFDSDEDLLRSGGLPIDMLDNAAFGFNEESVKQLMPEQLKIRWKNDLYAVKWEIEQEGISDIDWAKKVDLTEPIDVDYWKSEELKFSEGFYIQDGHHRYYAAKILNKPLNVNLQIKVNPIVKMAPGLGYDDFHRCAFAQVKNIKTESIRKFVRKVLKENKINEEALRLKNLPKDAALFIKEINQGYNFVLYNPKDKAIYATITIVNRDYYGPDFYYVNAVAAEKGLGPFIYELAMMHIFGEKMGLMPQRDGDVRGDAFGVWENFYERSDVKKNTLDLLDDNFRCDIIVGNECAFDDDEDKLIWWSELNSYEKNALKVFNTKYYIQPDSQYYELKKRGEEHIKNAFDIQKAIDSASNFWDSAYMS